MAHHALGKWEFEREHDRHDVELGIGLVAAKRASLVGRGPVPSDITVALEIFALAGPTLRHEQCLRFAGLAHSYVAQRRFVDGVAADQLLPGESSA